MRKLPPLKALRAFESAARHLSFSDAADELFVTPGAISQQIKLLEEFLGLSLFKRLHRKILLTDAGQSLLPGLQDGFETIGTALDNVQAFDLNRPITISASPSFAGKWLVPRLGLLREQHPEITIRLDTSIHVVDLLHSDVDIGIRFGGGNYPGHQVDLLFCQEVFPVCHPKVLEKTPLITPSDLKNHHLLHLNTLAWASDADWPDWQMWLLAAGEKNVDTKSGAIFDQQEMLVEAALDGQGIALVGSVTVAEDLRKGRLVKPFDVVLPQQFSYYFVTSPAKAQLPNIVKVREWVFNEIANSDLS